MHPNTPITVVEGPLAAAQLLETPLLNQLNFPTLIATKAARRRSIARLSGARAWRAAGGDWRRCRRGVGGDRGRAINTSNAAVGYQLGLDPAGTHAHSMVQLFLAIGGGEADAFDHYADVYPDDCLLLVDTVDTLGSGIPNAIATFGAACPWLSAARHPSDSGDPPTCRCSRRSSWIAPGSGTCRSCCRSQLDEITIWQIMSQIAVEARRASRRRRGDRQTGDGRRLTDGHQRGAPSLDGVFQARRRAGPGDRDR